MPEIPSNVTVDLSRTFGPILIGSILTTAFWSITCFQMLFYLRTYSSDNRTCKTFVVLLWILLTCHEILSARGLWTLLIPRFSDLTVLATSQDLILATPISYLVAALAQSFFIWRIWRFSDKNWLFPVILVPPSLWIFVSSIGERTVYACKTLNQSLDRLSEPEIVRLVISAEATVTVVDVLIAAIMSVLLYRGRSGYRISNTLIVRLIFATITTGTCTAIFGLIGAITLAWPDDLFYALASHPMCSVYCNTVLANLNARQYINEIQCIPSNFTDVELSRPIELDSIQPTGVGERSVMSMERGDDG